MTEPTTTSAPEAAVPPISPEELSARLDDALLSVVDVRPIAAFNGWRLGDEARGGHIPGAVAFPAAWFDGIEREEIQRLLTDKGVLGDRTVIVYGRDDAEAERASRAIASFEAGSVRTLAGGFTAWAAAPDRPIESLPFHERLVHGDWLEAVLDGRRPEAAPEGPFLLFHVNFGVPEEYAEGHIPGARYLDTNWLENPIDWNRRTPAELEDAVRRLGITRDTTVVVYGRDTVGGANEKWPGRRAGQIAATRALLILRYAGVEDVRLLDGGYDWWVNSGRDVERVIREPAPIRDFGATIPVNPSFIVDIDEAKEIIADRDGAALVSVRTWKEHIGVASGYNYIEPAGRIAGDVWGNCGSDAYHMQHYRNVDNTMRAYPEIAANWAEVGITGDRWVAFYCGTGWRASETWLYAALQGWDRIAVYDGGWFEWSKDPVNNPIETGVPGAVVAPREYAA